MEQKQYEKNPDGTWHYHIEVVEHTKSDAGYRTIYVVSSALEVFDRIKNANLKRGFSCQPEDYILKDAMQFSGHRDVQTYIKHYCFSRYSDEQKRMELEKTLNDAPN